MPRMNTFSRRIHRSPVSPWPITPQSNSPRHRACIAVEEVTGPLLAIEGRQILVLADVENLNYSARDLGHKVSYRTLTARLSQQARACSLHAFYSHEPGNDLLVHYFLERSWTPHPRDIETVRTHRGKERETNSDNLILFMAGVLASRCPADLIVLASGDGQLVNDLAKGLGILPKRRSVVTLSLAGSTAQRLNAVTNRHITANIEIGRDCLHPLSRRFGAHRPY